ncbi:MAG: tetratricopeptide repeat protein [Phormidesmis sp. CAN_BIN44]|nr:tetratricopeptide repeat protein [Phormidesmis sp. CAN_BIN44]
MNTYSKQLQRQTMHPLQTLIRMLGVITAVSSVVFTACSMPAFSHEGEEHQKSPSSDRQSSGTHPRSPDGKGHSMPMGSDERFSQIESARSRSAERFLNQGLDDLHKKDYEKALQSFTKALEFSPSHADAHTYRGNLYYSLGRYQEAIVDYSRALESNPTFSYLYNRRGASREALKDYQGALEDYNQSIKLYPEQGATYRNLGSAHSKLNDDSAALKNLNQAVQLNPTLADAYQMRGEIYVKQENLQAAIADFQQASKLFADQGDTQNFQKVSRLVQELQKQPASQTTPAAIAP